APGEGVLLGDGPAQPDDVLRAVVAPDPGPALVGLPRLAQIGRLLADGFHGDASHLVLPAVFPLTTGLTRRAPSPWRVLPRCVTRKRQPRGNASKKLKDLSERRRVTLFYQWK